MESTCRFAAALCAASFLVAASAAPVLAGPFPLAGQDSLIDVGASFKVVFFDGAEVAIENLQDPESVIGRSDPFLEAAEPPGGVPVDNAGYPDTAAVAPDPIRFPLDFPEGDPNRREVHTEILDVNLVNGFFAVLIGQPAYDALALLPCPPPACPSGNLSDRYQNSFGEVASNDPDGTDDIPPFDNDFPAQSFFDIFAVVETPVGTFANIHPLVLTREAPLYGFPPEFGLPEQTYIHDPSFPAVTLYSTESGLAVGWLQSAGHGQASLPPGADAAVHLKLPISFSVDDQSQGLTPAQSTTNDVRDDSGQAKQQVTVYKTTQEPYENERNPGLTGTVGALPSNFQAGDTINSMSSGRDGTKGCGDTVEPEEGVLHFSVDRFSQGAAGTGVNLDATAFVPRQAAAIYATGVDLFGSYCAWVTLPAPRNNNFLVVDPTFLGLRPSLFDADQDNLTGVEASHFQTPPARYYGSFTGPSFALGGNRATIFLYDPAVGPFEHGSLQVYATPVQLGLLDDDEIDALAVSDTGALGVAEAGIDEVLFSLAPGSPTLALSGSSAADIFFSPLDNGFSMFANHASLGLLPADNVDAIDIKPVLGPIVVPSVSFGGLALLGGLVLAVGVGGLAARRRRGAL